MESERKIEVEFDSNEKDFQRVLLWYHWKRMFLEYLLMFVVGIPLCYFLAFNVLEFKNVGWAIFVFFGTLITLLLLDIYRRCYFQANKLSKIAKPSKTTFSQKGLESKTPTTSSIRDWESYARIYETKTDFIFFQEENAFATIPKRFFKNNDEINDLRELIRSKLGEKAQLKN